MKIDTIIDAFVSGDYFILFLALTLMILLVLVLALIKSRGEYNELLDLQIKKAKEEDKEDKEVLKEENVIEELSELIANTKDDVIDEEAPLIKQIDINEIKTPTDEIDNYEYLEEESAVISREELEKRTQERMDALGSTENQEAIAKYEEEQEKKAIISYEQLVKNASNFTLAYTEEDVKGKDAPKVNKIEVQQGEVTGAESYLAEEEFLKILKEFRANLNENISN